MNGTESGSTITFVLVGLPTMIGTPDTPRRTFAGNGESPDGRLNTITIETLYDAKAHFGR